jgi:ribosomal protein L22
MSAEEETGVGETPESGEAAARPAAKKRAAAKKPAAAKEPVAKAEDAPAKAPVASEAKKARSAPAKPARRRVVRAHARYVRTSARKARMVSGHLPGKSVGEARAILAFTPREVARDWSKLLESAVANAENNHELLEDDLVVREAYADEGPTIKRFRPRAMGRATPIHKRTSHLTITLTPGS